MTTESVGNRPRLDNWHKRKKADMTFDEARGSLPPEERLAIALEVMAEMAGWRDAEYTQEDYEACFVKHVEMACQ